MADQLHRYTAVNLSYEERTIMGSVIAMDQTSRLSEIPRRYRRVLSGSTMTSDRVRNSQGEDLGKIEEIMIDIPSGKIAYAVLSFGGILGVADKLFAIPWSMLALNEDTQEFVLEVSRAVLEDAPGFDEDHWPAVADPSFLGALSAR
jgi:sporulation protein YlmC with PRC-barrel domain